jgi:hypothetical protein
MARFKLNPGVTEKDLGKAVLEIAEDVASKGGRLDEADRKLYSEKLKSLMDPAFAYKLEVLYDTSATIHIIIPDLGGAVYSGNDFANECMGSIVIRGCGS